MTFDTRDSPHRGRDKENARDEPPAFGDSKPVALL
jgi:hypothetical protein